MRPRKVSLCVEPSLLGCFSQQKPHGFGGVSSRASSAVRENRATQRAMPRASQSGYTLIEVIVAFAVLALALTLLLGTLSGAARLVRQANDGGRAALYAQSLLDQAGVGSALQPGQQQGEFEDGRYRWTLQIAPYADPGAPLLAPPGNAGAQLFELVLDIDWGPDAAQRLQLRSLRLSQPDTVQSVLVP